MTKPTFSSKRKAERARENKGSKNGEWTGLVKPDEGEKILDTAKKLGMGSVLDDLRDAGTFPGRRR